MALQVISGGYSAASRTDMYNLSWSSTIMKNTWSPQPDNQPSKVSTVPRPGTRSSMIARQHHVGDCVLLRFPSEEMGSNRSCRDPGMVPTKSSPSKTKTTLLGRWWWLDRGASESCEALSPRFHGRILLVPKQADSKVQDASQNGWRKLWLRHQHRTRILMDLMSVLYTPPTKWCYWQTFIGCFLHDRPCTRSTSRD